MPDKFTEVSSRGWGTNIMNSIKGVVFGLILFVGSFVVLWMNEGRQDMSEAAELCMSIKPDMIQTDAEGKPVCVSSKMTSEETLGDPEFLVPGDYIALSRQVEMFAWVENQSSEEKKKIGGGTETVTTYTYEKKWTSSSSVSTNFRYPEGHENPVSTIEDKSFMVQSAKVGAYGIAVDRLSLPGENPVDIKQNMLISSQPQSVGNKIVQKTSTGGDVIIEGGSVPAGRRLEGGYIYIGKGSLQNPGLGDVRIKYSALPKNIYVTVFGKLQGDRIVPFMYKGEYKLYRAFAAERDESIATLHKEYKVTGWILRIVGFLMMWIGLSMFFGPINAVLDVLPILGSVGRGIVSFVMFFVALILSLVTILISMIAHNLIALIITLVVIITAGIVLLRRAKKKSPAQA
jgi:hypothetical protein